MGNFDGVHLGHRAVIAAALEMGKAHGRPALAVTFEPHPRRFFSPNTPQFRLTDETAKLRLLAGTGLAGAVVMTFDKARAGTTAQDFIHHDLIERLGISGIAVGYDFHFGKGRVGSPSLLGRRGPAARHRGRRAAACRYRRAAGLLQRDPQGARGGPDRGRHRHARRALVRHRRGDPWREARPRARLSHRQYPPRPELRAQARHLCGAGRPRSGRSGASTASRASAAARPSTMARRCWKSSCSISRATSTAQALDVAFIGFIRDELKFDSVDALIRQMDDDSARARAQLAAAPGAFPKLGDDRLRPPSGLCDFAPPPAMESPCLRGAS